MNNFTKEIKFNRSFNQIVNFYLFECAVSGKSAKGKIFEEYGWEGTVDFSRLRSLMLSQSTKELRKRYFPSKKDELNNNYLKMNLIDEKRTILETIVFLKHDEKTVMQSLFSAIRNSFAHGSFEVIKYRKIGNIYHMQNHDKYMKAILIIHESTLINWIGLVKNLNNIKKLVVS